MTKHERFMQKIKINLLTGCWEWTASKLKSGYGMFGLFQTRPTLAHRASWILFRGDIPDGMYVLHKCDNPSCVNPDHLFIGSQSDNIHDMIQKGRFVHIPHQGEKNGRAKLTERDVIEMRRLKSSRKTLTQIAELFGMSKSATAYAINGKNWKHL